MNHQGCLISEKHDFKASVGADEMLTLSFATVVMYVAACFLIYFLLFIHAFEW